MLENIDLLIVDDEPQLRELLVEIFRRQSLNIRSAGTGVQALRVMETCKPKVLLTDIYMPEMDGLELILRARETCPELKIIAISGGGTSKYGDQLESAAMFGADAVLTKPLPRAALVEKVTAFLLAAPGVN